MSNIRPNYKKRRAKLIMDMREKGLSYNKISFALNGSITPQRVKQIVDHYKRKIEPMLKKDRKEFLDSLESDKPNT